MAGRDENPRPSALFLAIFCRRCAGECGRFASPMRRRNGGSLLLPFICNYAVLVPSRTAIEPCLASRLSD